MVADYDEDEKHRYNESLVKRGEILVHEDDQMLHSKQE
jgi:hypothetical protein